MSISDRTNPYERFMDPGDRERLITSLQRQFKSVSSDEIEDSHSDMLERLTRMTAEQVEEIDNPATWMYVGMRSRLVERLRLRRSTEVQFGDLTEVDILGDLLSDEDDSVVGTLIGRETVDERVAEIAEIVWLKFEGQDAQIAARLLLEKEGPNAVASELGLDLKYVQKVAKKAYEELRILEDKVGQNPEFRCWRLRKHKATYLATGKASIALEAHWLGCPKCKAAKRTVREHTHRVLAPFLPMAAAPAGLLSILRHPAHHALHPVRSLRRAIRPAAHLGGKTAAGSTQVSSVAGVVTSKVAVVAVTAAVAAGGAGAVAVVHHFTAHHRAPVRKTTPVVTTTPSVVHHVSSTPTITTPARTTTVVHHTPKHKAKPKPKHKRKRRAAHHVTRTTTTTTPPPAAVTSPATTTAAPPVTTTPAATTTPAVTTTAAATTTAAPPAKTTASSSASSQGQVTNPSYQTPSAP